MEDVTRVARALATVNRPLKMNYELLGNQVPHIHWHLIPRLAADPAVGGPVWVVEHPPQSLSTAEQRARIAEIRGALAGAL
jgi:diadenosine tetraphosphate (Ap4A) HIT family hydrolase